MADMDTSYLPGGAVSTTTRVPGLPGLPGGGGEDPLAFFREMAMRAVNQRRQDRSAPYRRAGARTADMSGDQMRGRMAQDAAMAGGSSFAKNITSRPGIEGGFVRTHAGDPGAVMGGWVPGGSDQPRGPGSFSNAGEQGDALRAQRSALDFQRFGTEQRARGMRTDGRFFDEEG